jgi:hypothetical protein
MGEKGQEKMAKKEKMRRRKKMRFTRKVGVYKIIKRILVTVRDCIKKDYDKGAT